MKSTILSLVVAAAFAAPAVTLAAPPASTHGAAVSKAAHDAQASGQPVGPQVRTVARSKSRATARSSVIAPRTIDVPRNTLITSTHTVTLNPDGSVRSREVASNTKARGKVKYRTY
jgi:hypothetical protein